MFAKMVISVSYGVENMVGKAENAGCQHFLLFPHFFQKIPLPGCFKVGIVWERIFDSEEEGWLIDCLVFHAVCNIISLLLLRPAHLSMLSWTFSYQDSA